MKNKCLLLQILILSLLLSGLIVSNSFAGEERLWEKDVHLNQLFCDNPELRPDYGEGWEYVLYQSEECPHCKAFTYYHRSSGDNLKRKCARCGKEWVEIIPVRCPNCGSTEVKEGDTFLVTHYLSPDNYHSSGLYIRVSVCKECGVLYVKKNEVETGKAVEPANTIKTTK